MAIVLGLGVATITTYVVATNTTTGRRWLLGTLITNANAVFGGRGSLRVGILRDIGLSRVVLEQVSLVDTAGVAVATAERVEGSLSIKGLFSKAIHIRQLTVRGLVLNLRQEAPGRPWNIAHIISGDTITKAPRSTLAFGDDVRIDALVLDRAQVLTRAPWAPHPIFVGRARDSVIVVRDSLHDLERVPSGSYFERRRITLDRVVAHDVVVVDANRRPSSLQLDTLRGVISDPPVPVRQAAGRIQWTSDSLRLELGDVQLPASRGTASGTVAWDRPGPVRFDVITKVDAALADLTWIWDVLPKQGRGTASVRMRTLADAYDAEYALSNLDVQSGASRVQGDIAVTVRPADLLLHRVNLSFLPMQSDLLRRLSYEALPEAVQGTFAGQLVAREGGPLTAFKLDLMNARFTDAAATSGGAISEVQLRGMLAFGAAPRGWNMTAENMRVDLRLLRALAPTAPLLDGVIAGSLALQHADLASANVTRMGLVWTDAANNVSMLRGNARLRYDTSTPLVNAALTFDPISMRALARVDTTLPLRSRLAGAVTLNGALDSLRWSANLMALDGDVAAALDSSGHPRVPSLVLSGMASLDARSWRGTAQGELSALNLRSWFGTDAMPATALSGALQLDGAGPLDTTAVYRADSTLVQRIQGGGTVALRQSATDERPAFDLIATAHLGATRLLVDSATAHIGGVTLEARGALARDSTGRDTLQVAARADSLVAVRGQLTRLAAMMQPVDTALASTFRALAADTLSGDASISGYLVGSLFDADATAALGARALQVGAIRTDRVFGSALATSVFVRPLFSGTVNADAITGVAAVNIQSATLAVREASADSGRIVLDVSTNDDAHLVVRGGYQSRDASTTWRLDSVRLAYDSVTWRSEAPMVIAHNALGITVQPSALRSSVGGMLTVSAEVPVAGAVRGDLRMERFPFGEVSALLAGTAPVAGTITGKADLAGTRQAPLISWDLAADSMGIDGVRLPRITSTGTYADQRLTARAQLRDSLGGAVRAEGRLPMDLRIATVEKRLLSDGVEGEIVADSLRLAALPLAIDGVSAIHGMVTGRLTLNGTVDRPTARGTVVLENMGARFEDLGIAPTNGRAVLRAEADSLVLESLRVQSGATGDTIGVRGVLHFATDEPMHVDARLTARNFVVARQRDGTDLDIAGDVRVVGPVRRPVVSGNLVIPRANLVVDPLGARTALDLSSDAARALLGADEVPVAATAAQTLASLGSVLTVENARVDLGNDVWVQTPEARVKLAGGLTVQTNGELLALDGEITANRGQYRLEMGVVNRSFSVDSGRVRFYGNNAIAPTLDISATNVVRVAGGTEIPVRVHIGGNYDKPVLTLSSTDPLYASAPESEIISLLIFGAPTFALDGQSQSTVRAVTGVLLPSVGGAAEGALQRLLPWFNTVQVSTAGSQTNTALSPTALLDNLNLSVSAGKQIGERTFLRLNTGICRGTGQTASSRGASLWGGVAAEYRLARHWWGQVGVDPGSAPCTRPSGDAFPRLQFGFDLFREWIF